jgi:hypothetical protein
MPRMLVSREAPYDLRRTVSHFRLVMMFERCEVLVDLGRNCGNKRDVDADNGAQ